jgi:BAG domain
VESSLKAELESRLGNEYASEVRDTIQAILASLSDSSPAPASAPTSASTPSPAGSSKGKEKALAPVHSSENATSKDVIQSLDEVHNIEAAFSALETEFTFPSQLDFITSNLAPDRNTSDSEAPATSHLAYTSRNHPVRFYEQALGSLLTQLDSVDSFGNDDLRVKRKQVVDRVEKALEELETEVEGRWRTRVAKESKSFRVTVTDAVSEAPTVTAPDAAAEIVPFNTEEVIESPAAVPEDASASVQALASEEVIDALTPEESSVSVDTPPTDNISADESSAPSQAVEVPVTGSDIHANDPTDPEPTDTSSITSLVESTLTVRPTDTDVAVSPVEPDTFLLPAYPAESPKLKGLPTPQHDVDVGSDWSEIEA